MEKSEERLKVIDNIKIAVDDNEFNRKVELGDPVITQEQREKKILHYDSLKKNIVNKIKYLVITNLTHKIMLDVNKDTEIVGIENLKGLDSGAIITSNHFNVVDTTIIRYMLYKIGKENKFNIIVQETNFFMEGKFGPLIRNNKTIPLSLDHNYISKNFEPTISKLLNKKEFILIYPEEEMWFNYRKPRPTRSGAYRYAAKYSVPIIPCFTKIEDLDELDENGFKKSKYVLYIMPPIYPDKDKSFKENKKELQEKDYACKVEMYEKAYGKELDYSFNEKEDIAGW